MDTTHLSDAFEIASVSYVQDLADKLRRDCRRVITSGWYQQLFPTRLAPRHQAVSEFETTRLSRRLATLVGGMLTGVVTPSRRDGMGPRDILATPNSLFLMSARYHPGSGKNVMCELLHT